MTLGNKINQNRYTGDKPSEGSWNKLGLTHHLAYNGVAKIGKQIGSSDMVNETASDGSKFVFGISKF